jgi:hypothetical protein
MGMQFRYVRTTIIDVIDGRTEKLLTSIPRPDVIMSYSSLIPTSDGLFLLLESHVPSQDDDVPYEYDYRFLVYRLENLYKEPH